MLKVAAIVGARPQFVKAAVVSRALRSRDGVQEILIHTGQHYDANMSDVFFDELDIPRPDCNLGIGGGSHGQNTGRMIEAIESLLVRERPDVVLLYGDTDSTLAGALAAAKRQIPVAHVEAGLRSFKRSMPEEINRVLTDHVSTLLFCPTSTAVANLRNEGIVQGIHHVGDVMYDVMLSAVALSSASGILDEVNVTSGCYSVATVHRHENTSDPEKLAAIFEFLRKQAKECAIVLPLHPRTRTAIQQHAIAVDGLVICGPLGYLDMAKLLAECRDVFTDSGGLQKEAYFHRKPCVTLRDETEWRETIDCGWNRLWKARDFNVRSEIDEYGNGESSHLIATMLLSEL